MFQRAPPRGPACSLLVRLTQLASGPVGPPVPPYTREPGTPEDKKKRKPNVHSAAGWRMAPDATFGIWKKGPMLELGMLGGPFTVTPFVRCLLSGAIISPVTRPSAIKDGSPKLPKPGHARVGPHNSSPIWPSRRHNPGGGKPHVAARTTMWEMARILASLKTQIVRPSRVLSGPHPWLRGATDALIH